MTSSTRRRGAIVAALALVLVVAGIVATTPASAQQADPCDVVVAVNPDCLDQQCGPNDNQCTSTTYPTTPDIPRDPDVPSDEIPVPEPEPVPEPDPEPEADPIVESIEEAPAPAVLPRTGADAATLLLGASMLIGLGAGFHTVSRRR